jgi:hypothetical protein
MASRRSVSSTGKVYNSLPTERSILQAMVKGIDTRDDILVGGKLIHLLMNTDMLIQKLVYSPCAYLVTDGNYQSIS